MKFIPKSKLIKHGDSICHELSAFLDSHKEEFASKLIPDLSHIDHMAHNVNGITIEEVTFLDSNTYQLDYTYDWEVYRGCSDMNEYDTEKSHVIFTLDDDGSIELDYLEIEERDTFEEF